MISLSSHRHAFLLDFMRSDEALAPSFTAAFELPLGSNTKCNSEAAVNYTADDLGIALYSLYEVVEYPGVKSLVLGSMPHVDIGPG